MGKCSASPHTGGDSQRFPSDDGPPGSRQVSRHTEGVVLVARNGIRCRGCHQEMRVVCQGPPRRGTSDPPQCNLQGGTTILGMEHRPGRAVAGGQRGPQISIRSCGYLFAVGRSHTTALQGKLEDYLRVVVGDN